MNTNYWGLAFTLLLLSSISNALSPADPNMPGVYDVASNGEINISVTDMHRYDAGQREWVLTLGLVVESMSGKKTSIDSTSFKIIDSVGYAVQPLKEYPLKNSLGHRDMESGEVAVGSIAFKLADGTAPAVLVNEDLGISIRLDKKVSPPGTSYPPGVPVAMGDSIIGIEGISGSEDGKKLRIDYVLKNSGPGPLLLEGREYGKFGVLVDAYGWSYSAYEYKMQGPAIPPGGTVDGYMIYAVQDGSDPRYLLFWPPEEDAILFDLVGLEPAS